MSPRQKSVQSFRAVCPQIIIPVSLHLGICRFITSVVFSGPQGNRTRLKQHNMTFFYNLSIASNYDFSYIFSTGEKSLVLLFHNTKY